MGSGAWAWAMARAKGPACAMVAGPIEWAWAQWALGRVGPRAFFFNHTPCWGNLFKWVPRPYFFLLTHSVGQTFLVGIPVTVFGYLDTESQGK